MRSFLFCVFAVPFFAQAQHREHGAHVHGQGALSIAFDSAAGTVEFTAPGDSVYGFEHEAKKKSDKAKIEKAHGTVEKRIGEIVVFHPSLSCKFTKTSIETARHGGESHSEMQAKFSVLCDRSPRGTTLRLNPAKVFPKLKDVDVTILVDDDQKSAEAGPKGTEVAL